MTRYYNRLESKNRRRQLRSNLTKPEVLLWSKLKNRQLLEKRFRRQFSIGPYVVDFYCPELKLVVEVDGEDHFVGKCPGRDAQRTAKFEESGIHVVRFTNDEIMRYLNGVLEFLVGMMMQREKVVRYPPRPPLFKGGSLQTAPRHNSGQYNNTPDARDRAIEASAQQKRPHSKNAPPVEKRRDAKTPPLEKGGSGG